ncbi:hypothetical protein MFIFM68171_05794 [Madurella fahalii]|uniref:Uncharacterized protein n=1 Tax=Madurella fahalii TaxID=1157608 RepID=A0ABQ0GD12_9PEZI
MPHRILLALASAVLVITPYARAQIASCAEVECPVVPGTTSAMCTVADKTFDAVGFTFIRNGPSMFLSWLKGVGAEDVSSSDRVYDQSFYFGTPPGFDFGGTGACALFFTQVSESVRFDGDDPRRSQGTCQQAMSEECVSALVTRAKAVDLDGLSGEAACERLQQDFSSNFDSACSSFATGSRWSGITAHALSGPGSPEPITGQQNASSNCWPVRPKDSSLRLVASLNSTGDTQVETLVDNFFGVTPILTVFFPGDSDNIISQREASLTCLKAIESATDRNGATDSGENGTVLFEGAGSTQCIFIGDGDSVTLYEAQRA